MIQKMKQIKKGHIRIVENAKETDSDTGMPYTICSGCSEYYIGCVIYINQTNSQKC